MRGCVNPRVIARIRQTFGHLCTLKEPHDYTPQWKSWSLGSLPMIPPRFGIKLIDDRGIEKQFAIIKGLMQQADMIVNCGDAGQEGELIQRWVMQKAELLRRKFSEPAEVNSAKLVRQAHRP